MNQEHAIREIVSKVISGSQVDLCTADIISIFDCFGGALHPAVVSSPMGVQMVAAFTARWWRNREMNLKKQLASIDEVNADLDQSVTCCRCQSERKKVETRKLREGVVCFECAPIRA